MKIKTIEIAGLASALTALRLPFGKEVRSMITTYTALNPGEEDITFDNTPDGFLVTLKQGYKPFERNRFVTSSEVYTDPKDIALMQILIERGDEHAKVLRGILVWAKITAPIYFYRELETYRAGRERLASNSTMHQECRGLSGEELQRAKAELPMGLEQDTTDMFSYQTLRRIVQQRHNHRLPEWHTFVDWVRTLPFAEELILVGLELD